MRKGLCAVAFAVLAAAALRAGQPQQGQLTDEDVLAISAYVASLAP